MTMSKDRVKFTITANMNTTHIRAAFAKAFGVDMPQHIPYMGTIVICRPSQFARFLIYRNDEGGRNSFKELNPSLIPATDIEMMDVSRNPARDY